MLIVMSNEEIQALAVKNGIDKDQAVETIKSELSIPHKGVSSVDAYPTNIHIWYNRDYIIDLINEDLLGVILDPAAIMTMCSEELRAKWFTEKEQLFLAKEIDKAITMAVFENK